VHSASRKKLRVADEPAAHAVSATKEERYEPSGMHAFVHAVSRTARDGCVHAASEKKDATSGSGDGGRADARSSAPSRRKAQSECMTD